MNSGGWKGEGDRCHPSVRAIFICKFKRLEGQGDRLCGFDRRKRFWGMVYDVKELDRISQFGAV